CREAPFTGGENGLQGVPRGTLLGVLPLKSDLAMYYVVLAVFSAVFVFIRRLVHSPFGQVLKAIRDNESRAVSLGYEINRYKLVAFVLSATLAGLAGSLKALVLGVVTVSDGEQSTAGDGRLRPLVVRTGTSCPPRPSVLRDKTPLPDRCALRPAATRQTSGHPAHTAALSSHASARCARH